MLKLKKYIPARTEVWEFRWCKKQWMQMSPKYTRIRNEMGDRDLKCKYCGWHYRNGEWMALAGGGTTQNITLCQKCAQELLDSEEQS